MLSNQQRCSPLEEKHLLDEHHCIHQQRSPLLTNVDALLEEKHQLDERHCIHQQLSPLPTNTDARLWRRSTSSTSATAPNISGRPHHPTPMLSSKRCTSSTSATAFTSSGHLRH
jgi:hypothetical protein